MGALMGLPSRNWCLARTQAIDISLITRKRTTLAFNPATFLGTRIAVDDPQRLCAMPAVSFGSRLMFFFHVLIAECKRFPVARPTRPCARLHPNTAAVSYVWTADKHVESLACPEIAYPNL